MEYAKIKDRILYNVGQRVCVQDTYTKKYYVGDITRIDTFLPDDYNLHVKINLGDDLNRKPIFSEAVVWPQPKYKNISSRYILGGAVEEA